MAGQLPLRPRRPTRARARICRSSGLARSETAAAGQLPLRLRLWPRLRDLERERAGATAVLSSHVIADVEQACDRIIVLVSGRVLVHDTVAGAVGSHAVHRGPGSAPAGYDLVASLLDESHGRRSLLRARSPGAAAAASAGVSAASLDDVVKGYLAADRDASR